MLLAMHHVLHVPSCSVLGDIPSTYPHLNEGTMRGAASGRPSCLASADTIPGHMLTMQCLATKPSKGTMRGAASGRTSCLASADPIPGRMLTLQRLVTKPSKGTPYTECCHAVRCWAVTARRALCEARLKCALKHSLCGASHGTVIEVHLMDSLLDGAACIPQGHLGSLPPG